MGDERIKELRKRLGISRAQLAAELGKSEPTLEKYEASLPVELAEAMAQLAEKKGYPDLALRFRRNEEGSSADYSDEDYRMLGKIKHSGIQTAIEAIQSNLRWFSFTAEALEGNTDIWKDVKTDEEAKLVATVLRVLRGGKTTEAQRAILSGFIAKDIDRKESIKKPGEKKAR